MRIGHSQVDSQLGDFEGNLAKVVAGLERAERERVEIVSFPECFLTGYPDTEEVARRDAFTIDSAKAMRVLDATSRFEPVVIVGFNELRGPDLFNTVTTRSSSHTKAICWKHTANARPIKSFTSRGASSPCSSITA